MTVNVDPAGLVIFGMASAALHWLVARSKITRPFWSRARGWLDALLRCAGCSGFWLGAGLWGIGLRPVTGAWWAAWPLAAVLAVFLTPVMEAILLWGLDMTSMDVDAPDDEIQ